MKKILNIASIFAALALVVVSCSKTEQLDTDQYDAKGVVLQAYGPQPVVRGGQLRFIGSNLDQVVSVTIPENNVITDIEVVSSGVHSEIRVTVPKETSAPGFPVLTLADGTTITAKTQLTYSEPILIESVTAEAYPGEDITITGDYLNLINEVIFTDDVKVSVQDFKTHERYKIVVTLPAEAQTGVVTLGTIDELAAAGAENEEQLLASLNLVVSEDELVVKTAVGTVAATSYKAGETVTINGTRLDLVTGIVAGGVDITDFTASSTKITFTLPSSVPDGEVVLVMASGVEVSAGAITTVEPSGLAAAPAPVKNGGTLTITGTNIDLVTGVEVPGAGWTEFENADGKITFTVGEAAQEGDITLHLDNGKTFPVAYTLVKPVVTGFSVNPASAGSDVTIEGTDLDLVAAVTFGGGISVEVEAEETAITVQVPTAAETGVLVLNLKNKTDIETIELAIDKPAGAYIPVFPEDLFSPGDMFIVEIENADHLTGVQVDGEDVVYILHGTTLYFQIPASAGANSQLTLVSDNGAVTYTMNIDPGDFIVTPIWTGNFVCEDWNGDQSLAWGGYDWSTVAPGTILRFDLTPTVAAGNWWCVSLRHGVSWGALAGVPGQYDSPEIPLDVVLTKEILDDLVASNGLVVTGTGFIMNQVSLVQDLRYGDTIWEGNASIGNWGGCQDLAWGGFDWSTVSAGQTLFFHFTPDVAEGEWFCISLRHGDNWGALAGVPGQYDSPENPFGVKLTQEIIDDLVSGNGLVVTGYMFTLTKVSLK